MHFPRCFSLSLISLFTALLTVGSLPAAPDTGYADQREYRMVNQIRLEHDPERRLTLLEAWKQLYPASGLAQERYQWTLVAEKQLGRGSEMWPNAIAMATADPAGVGPYWIVLLAVELRLTSPADLDTAEKWSQEMLQSKPMFAPDRRPEAVSRVDWELQRIKTQTAAHRALGWVALCRRQWAAAAPEFKLVLIHEPNDAESFYWLGTALWQTSAPARQSAVLYYFARALVIKGPSALSADERKLVQASLNAAYQQKHGSLEGIDALYRSASKNGALPPGL